MELIRGLHNLRPEHRGCVATIGNFDGVHRGHKAVLSLLARKAEEYSLPALVMLFEPQPHEYLHPTAAPARLMRLREKIEALRLHAVDRVLCVRFDARLAALEPEVFIDRILIEGIGVRYLVVGDDFRFGKNRRGDFAMLAQALARRGYEAARMPTFAVDGERVSSTRVRAALADGDLPAAEKLLGRPYRMSGHVAHGDRIGRTLGIPTANIHLHRRTAPLHGIYASEVHGLGHAPLPAAASVGTRPTVGGMHPLLELHLIDFGRDIYRAHVTVSFLKKLRDEARFESLEEMKRHILTDIDRTRQFFESRHGRERRGSHSL